MKYTYTYFSLNHIYLEYPLPSTFLLWVYICPCSWDASLGGSICLGTVFDPMCYCSVHFFIGVLSPLTFTVVSNMSMSCHSVLFSGSLSPLFIWTSVSVFYFNALIVYCFRPVSSFLIYLSCGFILSGYHWIDVKETVMFICHFSSACLSPFPFTVSDIYSLPVSSYPYVCSHFISEFQLQVVFVFLIAFFLPFMFCLSVQCPPLCVVAILFICLSICNVAHGSTFFLFQHFLWWIFFIFFRSNGFLHYFLNAGKCLKIPSASLPGKVFISPSYLKAILLAILLLDHDVCHRIFWISDSTAFWLVEILPKYLMII